MATTWLLEFGCHKDVFLYGNEHFFICMRASLMENFSDHLKKSLIFFRSFTYKLAKCLLDKLNSKAKTNGENF